MEKEDLNKNVRRILKKIPTPEQAQQKTIRTGSPEQTREAMDRASQNGVAGLVIGDGTSVVKLSNSFHEDMKQLAAELEKQQKSSETS